MKVRDHYDVRVREVGPLITDGDLDGCEERLGMRLPPDYRALLLRTNGGKPTPGGIAYKGASLAIERLYSVNAPNAEFDLVATCQHLREKHGLPLHYAPAARLQGDGNYLLVDCDEGSPGRLLYWCMAELGFRDGDPDMNNVFPLSYSIGQIPGKLGPLRNREDMDGLFSRLYWCAGNPQVGAKTAKQFVDAGYDINFVLAGCRHPVFVAMDGDAFNVVQALVALGTRADHTDENNATVVDRLNQALHWWQDRRTERKTGETVHEMAKRRIDWIEASLALYSSTQS